mmetsp:Transcript_5568/g.18203  ORF Transcript_5568/g.18203 Transcript_5568/m.18203 type:complete len:486 (-) Transcript_5568:896-2353(-)
MRAAQASEVELVHPQPLRGGERMVPRDALAEEVGSRPRVDCGGDAELEVRTRPAAPQQRVVLDVVDDERARVQKLGEGGEALEPSRAPSHDRRREQQPHRPPPLALPVGDGAHRPDQALDKGVRREPGHHRLELARDGELDEVLPARRERVDRLDVAQHHVRHPAEHRAEVVVLRAKVLLDEPDAVHAHPAPRARDAHLPLPIRRRRDDRNELLVVRDGAQLEHQLLARHTQRPPGTVLDEGAKRRPHAHLRHLRVGVAAGAVAADKHRLVDNRAEAGRVERARVDHLRAVVELQPRPNPLHVWQAKPAPSDAGGRPVAGRRLALCAISAKLVVVPPVASHRQRDRDRARGAPIRAAFDDSAVQTVGGASVVHAIGGASVRSVPVGVVVGRPGVRRRREGRGRRRRGRRRRLDHRPLRFHPRNRVVVHGVGRICARRDAVDAVADRRLGGGEGEVESEPRAGAGGRGRVGGEGHAVRTARLVLAH